MTRDEILALQPGPLVDQMVAKALHWKWVKTIFGSYWYDGRTYVKKWSPSTDWRDTGRLFDELSHVGLLALRLSSEPIMGGLTFYCEIEARDFFGVGPKPIVYFRARTFNPKMALCIAFLLMDGGYYEEQ